MKIVLNHNMCRIVLDESDNTYKLFIRMKDGKHAMQAPYPADQRGLVAAMLLATDVLAGKIILAGAVSLDSERPETPKLVNLTAALNSDDDGSDTLN